MGDISGLDQLNAAIRALQQNMSQQLPSIVKHSAEALESEIRARMPVKSGQMENALEIVESSSKTKAAATVQVADSGPDRDEHYAIFVEYGTSKMAAEPFFRPGVEAGKSGAASRVVDGISNVVKPYGN